MCAYIRAEAHAHLEAHVPKSAIIQAVGLHFHTGIGGVEGLWSKSSHKCKQASIDLHVPGIIYNTNITYKQSQFTHLQI